MKKLFLFSLVLLAAACIALPSLGTTVSAQDNLLDEAKCDAGDNGGCICYPGEPRPECPPKDPAVGQNCTNNNCNIFTKYLNPLIRTLAAFVGIAVTIGIVLGGIQYITSGGDPQKAAAGKQHIKMAVVALIGFLLMYAMIGFLFPGVSIS